MEKLLFVVMILFFSCKKENIQYTHKIVLNNKLDEDILANIKTPERVLLLGYLFVYGNECDEFSDKIKCKILLKLNINNECNTEHINELKKWFKNDVILSLKLQKCPVLPSKSAIQNRIEKIITQQNNDTITITINVVGMNTVQEKHWDIEQSDTFIIRNNSFIN
jgi:hypothetical protein